MMTLKEAIEHCKEKALTCDNKKCALDHFQLFKWLKEYQSILEKQDEQKPIDKVEPKFKVGDWVMLDRPVLITKIEDMPYNIHQYWTSDGTWFGDATKAKLWTIQDAKDGDVLATKAGGIFIYKELLYDKPFAYCGVDKFGVFKDCNCGNGLDWTSHLSDVTPATKEQRNLLFRKMKEEGYEWDSEKKELKKVEQKPTNVPKFRIGDTITPKGKKEYYTITDIVDGWYEFKEKHINGGIPIYYQSGWELVEQNPAWSEEDDNCLSTIIAEFSKCAGKSVSKDEWMRCNDFLNSLKDRVRPQPKQEWSEEDEEKINSICNIIADKRNIQKQGYKSYYNGLISWLKSLRPQNWTKEDKERYISCLQRLSTGNPEQPETINCKWFKEHVYPQSTWKPSDEQMEALANALSLTKSCGEESAFDLRTLHEQLAKLKEE